jgi:hypothetical protein
VLGQHGSQHRNLLVTRLCNHLAFHQVNLQGSHLWTQLPSHPLPQLGILRRSHRWCQRRSHLLSPRASRPANHL